MIISDDNIKRPDCYNLLISSDIFVWYHLIFLSDIIWYCCLITSTFQAALHISGLQSSGQAGDEVEKLEGQVVTLFLFKYCHNAALYILSQCCSSNIVTLFLSKYGHIIPVQILSLLSEYFHIIAFKYCLPNIVKYFHIFSFIIISWHIDWS